MKGLGQIFMGLCVLPPGVLTGNIWVFGIGAGFLLAGTFKMLVAMRNELDHPDSHGLKG